MIVVSINRERVNRGNKTGTDTVKHNLLKTK